MTFALGRCQLLLIFCAEVNSTKKFMLLYISGISAEEAAKRSPDDEAKGMEPWLVWQKKWGKAIVDFGSPLGMVACLDKKGSSKSSTQVTGYSIIQAKDADAAKEMLANHPHLLEPKASIQVLETKPM